MKDSTSFGHHGLAVCHGRFTPSPPPHLCRLTCPGSAAVRRDVGDLSRLPAPVPHANPATSLLAFRLGDGAQGFNDRPNCLFWPTRLRFRKVFQIVSKQTRCNSDFSLSLHHSVTSLPLHHHTSTSPFSFVDTTTILLTYTALRCHPSFQYSQLQVSILICRHKLKEPNFSPLSATRSSHHGLQPW